jgi:hypothetical protein
MAKTIRFNLSLLAIAMLALSGAQAANLAKADYTAGKTRIGAEFKADKATCAPLAGNAKDICVAEAKAKDQVALAELEFSYTGKASDGTKVRVTRAKTAYAVAKEKCDDQAGNAKAVCNKEAKAIEVKALADAKLDKQIGAAKTDATQDVRDADYKVAVQKCDALAGDAKSGCIVNAKAKFGKS